MEKKVLGRHLLANCRNVSKEVCLDDKKFLSALSRAVELAGANVISQVRYRLGHNSPPGFACVCLLDESHVSAHSYADLGLIALDLFTCGNTDPKDVFRYLQEEICIGEVEYTMIDRFEVDF